MHLNKSLLFFKSLPKKLGCCSKSACETYRTREVIRMVRWLEWLDKVYFSWNLKKWRYIAPPFKLHFQKGHDSESDFQYSTGCAIILLDFLGHPNDETEAWTIKAFDCWSFKFSFSLPEFLVRFAMCVLIPWPTTWTGQQSQSRKKNCQKSVLLKKGYKPSSCTDRKLTGLSLELKTSKENLLFKTF